MSTEEPRQQATDTSDSNPRASDVKGSRRLVVRTVIFLALAVAIVALVIDRRARHEVRTAFEKVDSAMGPERNLRELTAADVHKLIGREPDENAQAPKNTEVYSWRGAVQSFSLFVTYYGDGMIKDVSVNTQD